MAHNSNCKIVDMICFHSYWVLIQTPLGFNSSRPDHKIIHRPSHPIFHNIIHDQYLNGRTMHILWLNANNNIHYLIQKPPTGQTMHIVCLNANNIMYIILTGKTMPFMWFSDSMSNEIHNLVTILFGSTPPKHNRIQFGPAFES
jgi:hypothetical protein